MEETIGSSISAMMEQKLSGREFFDKTLLRPRHILAPMVEGSDLAFRLLTRRYNTHLTYTPMLYSRVFATSAKYRRKELRCSPEDRPLVVQFCGTSPEEILPAALIAQHQCDAIDINLGCPQSCARKGGYGAVMLEQPEQVFKIVAALHKELFVPVFCKMRILPDVEKTIQFAKGLEEAGCQLLVVHGRTIDQKGSKSGPCDWDLIKLIKESLTIPVIANGGLLKFEDVEKCLSYTGCDAVMSAESMLKNPAFFANITPDPCDLVIEYFHICKQHPTERKFINAHVYGMLIEQFQLFPHIRDRYRTTYDLDQCISLIQHLKIVYATTQQQQIHTQQQQLTSTMCTYNSRSTADDTIYTDNNTLVDSTTQPSQTTTQNDTTV